MKQAGQVTFEGLAEAAHAISALKARADAIPDTGTSWTSLAPRQIDMAQTAGHRVYIQAQWLIGFAHEHFQAFIAHAEHVGIEPRAPFTLLRPALEASLWALWLLDPDDSLTRRTRALHFEILDFAAESAYLAELGMMRSVGREVRDEASRRQATAGSVYRAEAEELGLDYAHLRKTRNGPNLVDEVPKLKHLERYNDRDTVRLIVAEWRRLSGYQHGKTWAVSLGSDRSFSVDIPGGRSVQIVASDNSIQMARSLTTIVLLDALMLYIDRCESPIR